MCDRQIQVLEKSRKAFSSGLTLSYNFRIEQLKQMILMLDEGQDEILRALKMDMRKPTMECTLEIEAIRIEIKHQIRHLKDYMRPEKIPLNLLTITDRAFIQTDPYGVVLILGTWNYPFSVTLGPLSGALVAGNCVIIKPSELAPHSSALLTKLIPRYLNNECFHVIETSWDGTVKLLENKFDYIFATGSTEMGRSLMATAAKHLTPLTLELGGKSPVYIHESADISMATKRILWGKCLNLGQTCVAPDFLICSKVVAKEFVSVANVTMYEWFGKNLQNSPDLPRIVNNKHFLRLQNILRATRGRIVFGGETDQKDLWISPTILADIKIDDASMDEEIFGPILPILTVDSPDDAIHLINSRSKALALYIFSKDDSVVQKFLQRTSSGGVTVNDVLLHGATDGLPFGGVGLSGLGSYHGKYSFDTFSHKKGVLYRQLSTLAETMSSARYPPHDDNKVKLFSIVLRSMHFFTFSFGNVSTHLIAVLLGAFFMLAYWNLFQPNEHQIKNERAECFSPF